MTDRTWDLGSWWHEPCFLHRYGLLYQADCLDLLRQSATRPSTASSLTPVQLRQGVLATADVNVRSHATTTSSGRTAWLTSACGCYALVGALFVYIIPQWGYHFAGHLEERGLMFRHWIALSMKGTYPRGRKLYPAHYALLYFTKGDPTTFNRVRLPIPVCRHCGKDVKDYGGHRKYLNRSGEPDGLWEEHRSARHQKSSRPAEQ